MKHSSLALIRSELRGHAEKKTADKTCCNQNMPALPLSDDLYCWSTITFSSNCSMQLIRVFLSVNELILHRLVSYCYSSLLAFSVMEGGWKWAYLEPQKVKMSQSLKSKKKGPLFFYINSGRLETTLTLTLWRRANAQNVSFFTLYDSYFMFSTQFLTLNYLLYFPTDAAPHLDI